MKRLKVMSKRCRMKGNWRYQLWGQTKKIVFTDAQRVAVVKSMIELEEEGVANAKPAVISELFCVFTGKKQMTLKRLVYGGIKEVKLSR